MILNLKNYGYGGSIKSISITPSCGGATKYLADNLSNEIFISVHTPSGVLVLECGDEGMTNKQINTLFKHIDLACTYPEHELLERFPEEFI